MVQLVLFEVCGDKLSAGWFQFHYGSISSRVLLQLLALSLGFNSTMVQLVRCGMERIIKNPQGFNSTMVQLVLCSLFAIEQNFCVSIPLWFN